MRKPIFEHIIDMFKNIKTYGKDYFLIVQSKRTLNAVKNYQRKIAYLDKQLIEERGK